MLRYIGTTISFSDRIWEAERESSASLGLLTRAHYGH